jgi:hypothetical protein
MDEKHMNRFLLAFSLGVICWQLNSSLLAASPLELPLLPDAVDSFGAAEHDGWLYVYGGHQGAPDQQSAKNVSRHFVRCQLSKPDAWEELPLDEPRQNHALVSCGEYLYRIGGAGASHADTTLCSVDDFVRFDPETKKWTRLKSLPAPRSAHDAIADEGKIYVVGGWRRDGENLRDWHDSALVYDTNDGEDATWQSLPIPSFRRRDLAVTTWQNCIWAIGGKDDNDEATETVFYYDPQRGYWSEGVALPMQESGMRGYGVAAWGLESGLYVSGADGTVYRLTDVFGDWQSVAQLRVPRYCHRLLPDGENTLLALAGHSVSFGATRNIERVKVYSP